MRNTKDLDDMACPEKYRKMGDFIDYLSGKKIAPILTLVIGGNHEASKFFSDLYYGGWLCSNIYYMGRSGVINFGPLRIMGISGIHNAKYAQCGYFEKYPYSHSDKKSIYCTREYEIAKCGLY